MSVVLYSTLEFLGRPAPAAFMRKHRWKLRFPARAKDGFLPPPGVLGPALMACAEEMEYLIAAGVRLDGAFFARASRLRWVGVFGAGFNHVDMDAATERGVLVTNTPGANARSTVELVLGFIFALARGVVPAHNRLMRGEWAHTLGMELYGKTLGIIGLGHIGTMLAEAARALGMEVAAHSRAPKPALVERLGLRQVGLEELLRLADFVSLNLPALPGGPPLIGRKEIALMKPGAYLINAARGQLLDYDALTEALAEGRLAGAGLDVFPHEPMSLQRMEAMRHPLFSLPNVVCTPHDGGMTGEAVDRVSLMNLQDLEQFLKGERSPRAINPQVYAGGCA